MDTDTKTDYISVSSAPTPPVAEFSGNPTSGNAPLTATNKDASTAHYPSQAHRSRQWI